MATNFGKGNRAIAFNPTSAFPLDARTYFESYSEALAKAQTAEEVGSTNTQYHYGMKLLVNENGVYTWYEISTDNTLVAESSGGSTVTSNGMSIPIISTTLTWNSTISDLRDVIRANGVTQDDTCIVFNNSSAIFIMVKIVDFDSSSTNIQVPIWYDFTNPLGTRGLVAANASTTIRTLAQSYASGLSTTNTDLRNIINELYNKAGEGGGSGGSSGKALPIITLSSYTITLEEIITELRNNSVTANDLCILTTGLLGSFIVKIGDPLTDLDKAHISLWLSLNNPVSYSTGITADTALPLSTTFTQIQSNANNQLTTSNKNLVTAINELNEKISATEQGMPIIRFVGVKSRRVDPSGDEEFPPTEMNLTNGISFIVEMTGGGSIQRGDSIQICQMKTYWYGKKGAPLFSRYRKQKLRCVAERVIDGDYIQEINSNGWKYLVLNSWETNEGKLNAAFCHNGRMDAHRVSSLYIRIRRPKGDLQNNESGRTVDAYFSNVVEITRKYTGDKMHFE